jgi:hypothetical protein
VDFRQLQKPPGTLWDAPRTDPAARVSGAASAPLRGMLPAPGGGEAALSPEENARRADRARTQEELREKFDVVPDDFEGERLPHQVTQAEYEQLCNNFSDIRTGNSQIKMSNRLYQGDEDWGTPESVETHRERTLDDVMYLLQTSSGRELINELATATDKDGNPLTTTIDWTTNAGDAKAEATDPEKRELRDNGVGTDMTIRYAPNRSVKVDDADADPWAQNARSDVLLFHELAHALHGVKGERQGQPVPTDELAPNDFPGISLEEYATMGIGRFAGDPRFALNENAYRRERRALAGLPGIERAGDGDWAMERRTSYVPAELDEEQKKRRGL